MRTGLHCACVCMGSNGLHGVAHVLLTKRLYLFLTYTWKSASHCIYGIMDLRRKMGLVDPSTFQPRARPCGVVAVAEPKSHGSPRSRQSSRPGWRRNPGGFSSNAIHRQLIELLELRARIDQAGLVALEVMRGATACRKALYQGSCDGSHGLEIARRPANGD